MIKTFPFLPQHKQIPNLSPFKIILEIYKIQGLDPNTITFYLSNIDDPRIRSEVRKISPKLLETKHKISEKWLQLKKLNSNLNSFEIIEIIAKEDNVDPVSIACYAKVSEN